MSQDADYVCSLDAATLKKAAEELHEDPKNRLGAVQTFREWILQQKHIKCPTDTHYLLSFLRTRKFSQLEARKLLQNYLSRRDKFSDWFKNIDSTDPNINICLDDGIVLKCGRDKEGRQVLIIRPGYIDANLKKYNKAALFRCMSCVLDEVYMLHEENQVHGTVILVDLDRLTLKHQTKITMEDRKNFLQSWQKHYPARIKGMHIYNIGAFAEFVMLLVKFAMSEKIQQRIVLHGQILEGVYKHLPLECLPEEYLPDDYTGPHAGSTKEIIERMKANLANPKVRERILYLSKPEFGIDERLKPDDTPQASFRKLNID